MLKVKNIDHVAIGVPDLAPLAATLTSLFGTTVANAEHVANQNTTVQFLDVSGSKTAIELICPSGNEALERFLAKRGSGLHHICFEVDDLTAALSALKAAEVPLIDEHPRQGARGHLVAFIHPRATGGVLFELCEHTPRESA